MNDLQEELQVIQNENLALYDEATTLRQQKNTKEHRDSEDDLSTAKDENANNDNNNNEPQKTVEFEEQIDMLISQQKKEEENRSAVQKKLQESMQKIKSLQESIDQQNLNIQRNLTPKLHNEETLLEEYYKNLIESCSKHPNLDIDKLKGLVDQFITKSKEVFDETEEIEKYHRLIQYNEPHYTPDEETEEEDSFENPLPCFSSQPPSLEEARTRRRVSFTLQ
ncbi:hypothetical protein M9Y10_035164 [Tritrichomonas musculus]|uniref:Uncharacterized protein n=1 Tax=Tritrichomonas musculus TaxID=1915356 RepID=A0ABR2KHU4_9EUKA